MGCFYVWSWQEKKKSRKGIFHELYSKRCIEAWRYFHHADSEWYATHVSRLLLFYKKMCVFFFYNFLSVCEIVKSVISLCCTRWQNYSSACATRGYLLLVSFCLLFAMCALPFMRTFHLSVLQLCSFSCRIYESFGVSYYFQSLSVVGRRMKMSGLQSQCATIDETFTTLRLMCNFHLPMRFQTVGMHLRRIWLLFCVWVGVCGGEQIKGNMFSNDTWR